MVVGDTTHGGCEWELYGSIQQHDPYQVGVLPYISLMRLDSPNAMFGSSNPKNGSLRDGSAAGWEIGIDYTRHSEYYI